MVRSFLKASCYFSILLLTFLTVILSGVNAQTRISQSINTNWKFYKGDIPGFPSTDSGNVTWEDVSVPHSWNTTDVTDDTPGYYRGAGWYVKTLFIPSSWKDKDIYLYFEGASQVADVYINGKKAGSHTGGYTAFSIPVSKYISFGNSGQVAVQLAVKVDNSYNADIPPLSADFTFFGGIYRDVYLVAANPVHFDMDNNASGGVFITTPRVTEASADVSVSGALVNRSGSAKSFKLHTFISDAGGKIIAQEESVFKVAKDGVVRFDRSVRNIRNPKLWSPGSPYLYRVTSTVTEKGSDVPLDEVTCPLGFRWFDFDPEKGFLLNGKPCKLIGASRHQDYKGMANAIPDAMHVRDVQLLKDMGANFLRVAHYPQDPEILQACDRLGILASVEIPVVNQITETEAFAANCRNMQVEMIRQNYNHPSVIIWAYMNEVLLRLKYEKGSERQKAYIKDVAALAQQLEDLTRKEDPSRYTMIPNHGDFDLYRDAGLTGIPGIVGWNVYQGWYSGDLSGFARFLDRHHKELPGKPLIVTEYGVDADPRLNSMVPVRFDKSNEYAVLYHKTYMEAIMERPFVAGAAIWNLADFNSEPRAEAMPHINTKGITTIERRPKDSYYFYQSQLLEQPFIRIGSRNRTLRSGIADAGQKLQCMQPVEVYTNQRAVTMKVNGTTLGTSSASKGVAVFNVPFVNGVNKLEAVTSVNGHEYSDAAEITFLLLAENLRDTRLPFSEINVSLGDRRYFTDEKLRQVWLPEKAYAPGSWGYAGGEEFVIKGNSRLSYGSDKNIEGTDDDPVYETQRVGIEKFKLDVPDGCYEVTLHFAELQAGKKQEELAYNLSDNKTDPKEDLPVRSFDVLVNSVMVCEGLSNATYLKPAKAYSTKTITTAKDLEGITVDFVAKTGKPILNGIQVRKLF